MPDTLTPAAELCAAAAVLRCDHRYPVNRPPGTSDRPGHCIHCGTPWRYGPLVADDLVEPLAELLADAAESYDWFTGPNCEVPAGRAVELVDKQLTLARLINGQVSDA